jgi:hypothetical protein
VPTLGRSDLDTAAPSKADHSFAARADIAATPDQLFARFDDQTRVAEHMERPSTMIGGGRMTYEFDEAEASRPARTSI